MRMWCVQAAASAGCCIRTSCRQRSCPAGSLPGQNSQAWAEACTVVCQHSGVVCRQPPQLSAVPAPAAAAAGSRGTTQDLSLDDLLGGAQSQEEDVPYEAPEVARPSKGEWE